MHWHEFVFSNQPRRRMWRHLTSSLLWWIFIFFTLFFLSQKTSGFDHHQPGVSQLGYLQYILLVLVKSFLLLLTHLLFCYAFIYVLLPNFLLKKKYWLLIAGLLLVFALMISVGYFLYSFVYPLIDNLFNLHSTEPDKVIVWRSIDAGLVNAIKVTLVAAAITLLKHWWLKQKEKEKVEEEKVNADLQLLKAQIHPTFLFSTLHNITEYARLASPKAPEMLIKLSDILSYMLYECDAPKVKLEKEIAMLREYISLEKMRQDDKLEITFQINGNPNGQMITPLLLLPFIDNSFSYSKKQGTEKAWVNLNITFDDDSLHMKLLSGIPAGMTIQTEIEHSLSNVKKRLQLLYPEKHELKINVEQELLIVNLNLKLEEAVSVSQVVDTSQTSLSYA